MDEDPVEAQRYWERFCPCCGRLRVEEELSRLLA